MRVRLLAAVLCCAGLGVVYGQDAPQNAPQAPGQGGGRWQGQRGGRGGMSGMMGNGTVGTVTEAAADHFTVKTELGDVYTIHFSANTRIMKQPPGGGQRRDQQGRGQQAGGQGAEDGAMRTPPQPIKATDIKVGDVIAASGEVDAGAKSVGAVFVMLIDPERAKEMRAMEANYGKTWLAGRVTAINEVKVSLEGGPDRAPHSFVADENTTFRKRRDPITLADVQVGDMVRAEGAVKDGTFVATTVGVMPPPPNGPRNGGGEGPGLPSGGPPPGGAPPAGPQ
jgi:Domain of unknown function (DUF5666)